MIAQFLVFFCSVLLLGATTVRAEESQLYAIDAGCNATLNKTTDKITSDPLNPNVTCIWKFALKKDDVKMLYLGFDSVTLDIGDSLTVINGDNETTDKVGNWTGQLSPFMVITTSEVTTVIIRTGPNKSALKRGVSMRYTNTSCKMTVTAPSALINLPTYVKTDTLIHCDYSLNLPKTDKLIALSFLKATLIKAQIQVFDGKKVVVHYLASNISSAMDVIGTTNSLTLKLAFSGSQTQNMTASMTGVSAGCSKVLVAPVVISSPGYPGPYDNNLDCWWIVKAPDSSKTLLATVKSIQLADDIDSLVMKHDGRRLGSEIVQYHLGSKSDKVLVGNNSFWIRFSTDDILTAKGFMINITTQDFGGYFNKDSGIIGWYPWLLPKTKDRTAKKVYYQLNVNSTKQVSLKILSTVMSTNNSIKCYDGDSEHCPLVGYFEQAQEVYHQVVSNSNKMLVVASNFSDDKLFFKAQYDAIDSGVVVNALGSTGVWNVSRNVNQSDLLIPYKNTTDQIMIQFSALVIPPGGVFTVYTGLTNETDSVLMKMDSTNKTASLLPTMKLVVPQLSGARLSYTYKKPKTGDDKTVVFIKADYSIQPGCQANLPTPSGNLTSPGYPNYYPLNSNCTWSISTNGKPVHIILDTKHIQQGHSLAANGQVINATSPVDMVLNGTKISPKFVNLIFQSPPGKNSLAGAGFHLSYKTVDCGGMYKNHLDSIKTPGFPKGMPPGTRCVWIIKLPKYAPRDKTTTNIIAFNYHLSKVIPDFERYVTIYDGASSLDRPMKVTWNVSNSHQYLSLGNALVIDYHLPQGQKTKLGVGLHINYTVYRCPKVVQCDNGICMHPDWRCDGIDQCGDMTDERNCVVPIPHKEKQSGISPVLFGVMIVITAVIASALTCLVPYLIRRSRRYEHGSMRDLMVPATM